MPRRSSDSHSSSRGARPRPGQAPRSRSGAAGRTGWGGVARKGAGKVRDGGPPKRSSSASDAWRAAGEQAEGRREFDPGPPPWWEPEEWIDEGEVRAEAELASQRGGGQRGRRPASGEAGAARRNRGERAPGSRGGRARRPAAAESPKDELLRAVGAQKAEKLQRQLKVASDSFKRGRFEEARKTLRPLADAAPAAASVRELYGLTLYRLGRWKPAASELEAVRSLTGDVEQHPVLADCYRALGRHRQVEELWAELGAASPSGDLVAEGRIVAAGSLADQGRISEAIKLLEPAVRPARKAQQRHLRIAYVLADLYERAGELPKAREMFQRVAAGDPDFVDVRSRLRSLD